VRFTIAQKMRQSNARRLQQCGPEGKPQNYWPDALRRFPILPLLRSHQRSYAEPRRRHENERLENLEKLPEMTNTAPSEDRCCFCKQSSYRHPRYPSCLRSSDDSTHPARNNDHCSSADGMSGARHWPKSYCLPLRARRGVSGALTQR
jgi:hypothetical protein